MQFDYPCRINNSLQSIVSMEREFVNMHVLKLVYYIIVHVIKPHLHRGTFDLVTEVILAFCIVFVGYYSHHLPCSPCCCEWDDYILQYQ